MLYYIHQNLSTGFFYELSTQNYYGDCPMQNVIINRLLDGSKAVITHWDHFHVNRATGSTIHRAFTIKYITGRNEGNSFVWPIRCLHQHFQIVGKDEVANVQAS